MKRFPWKAFQGRENWQRRIGAIYSEEFFTSYILVLDVLPCRHVLLQCPFPRSCPCTNHIECLWHVFQMSGSNCISAFSAFTLRGKATTQPLYRLTRAVLGPIMIGCW